MPVNTTSPVSASLLLSAGLLLATSACIIDDGSSFTVANESDYVLFEVNLAPEDSFSWGRNLLRGDVLYPGEAITIDFIECDYYDARVIDDTNLECILGGLDLCFDNELWVIDNTTLDICAFGP